MNILVGYDKSDASKAALRVAIEHAEAFKAKIHIVNSMIQTRELSREDIQRVELRLQTLKNSLKAEKVACEVFAQVSKHSAGESLVEFAMENEIDQIFIGVRRRSRVGKLILGSNAQYIILKAPCPVMAVK